MLHWTSIRMCTNFKSKLFYYIIYHLLSLEYIYIYRRIYIDLYNISYSYSYKLLFPILHELQNGMSNCRMVCRISVWSKIYIYLSNNIHYFEFQKGHLLAIYPGGVREALFSGDNYQLTWNKRTGFAKVALAARVVSLFILLASFNRRKF